MFNHVQPTSGSDTVHVAVYLSLPKNIRQLNRSMDPSRGRPPQQWDFGWGSVGVNIGGWSEWGKGSAEGVSTTVAEVGKNCYDASGNDVTVVVEIVLTVGRGG